MNNGRCPGSVRDPADVRPCLILDQHEPAGLRHLRQRRGRTSRRRRRSARASAAGCGSRPCWRGCASATLADDSSRWRSARCIAAIAARGRGIHSASARIAASASASAPASSSSGAGVAVRGNRSKPVSPSGMLPGSAVLDATIPAGLVGVTSTATRLVNLLTRWCVSATSSTAARMSSSAAPLRPASISASILARAHSTPTPGSLAHAAAGSTVPHIAPARRPDSAMLPAAALALNCAAITTGSPA